VLLQHIMQNIILKNSLNLHESLETFQASKVL